MQCGKGTQYDGLGVVHYIPEKLALDEAQASLRAARFATDLSASECRCLFISLRFDKSY